MMEHKSKTIDINEQSKIPTQVFPGQYVPKADTKQMFPNPVQIGEYVSFEKFLSLPKWQSSWVHWETRCEDILNGEYHRLKPVHYEGIFTLSCSFMCPHCTRRADREKAHAWKPVCSEVLDGFCSNDITMSFEGIKEIIDSLANIKVDNQMGIVWGGGDPTMNPASYQGMKYAYDRGLTSSFITNGVFLNIEELVSSKPTLVRISLNCGNEDTYCDFHGLKPEWGYFDRVKSNIKELNKLRVSESMASLFGISLIFDERNMQDFDLIAKYLVNLVELDGRGIDYIIVRPVMRYSHLNKKNVHLNSNTKAHASSLLNSDSNGMGLFHKYNIPVISIKDSFCEEPLEEYYKDKNQCLAYGMCGEIRYNGDVQLCSDSYGDPRYTIGNIFKDSMHSILSGNRRKDVLKYVNEKQCFKNACPHNSRGHHLNRMFYQVEALREKGQIDVARKWINDMRRVTFPLGHSFFI